jgi:D-sedoheptulose 7-phosphate isomerase
MKKMNIQPKIKELSDALHTLQSDQKLIETIEDVIRAASGVFHRQGRLLLCGNGGSAADAQHIAAELSGRYKIDRHPLDAEALHVNTSYLTAVANDYGFDVVYERLVQAKGREGDMLIALSTSGNSQNIINAIHAARDINMIIVGMTGNNGGEMKDICDFLINVPSNDTPLIQEMHIMIGHILCEHIEILCSSNTNEEYNETE